VTEIGDWESQIRRGLLELCVLALIASEPTYGYEIVTRLAGVPKLAAAEGTVYPMLRRLRQTGWLETTWQESDSGPPRQYYRLTPAGREYLKALRDQWRGLAVSVDGFLKENR
jgi:PadR family transcriptional regulator PadR